MYIDDVEFAPGCLMRDENDSNRHYSYVIIWFIYSLTVQCKTVLERMSENSWKVLFASKMFVRPLPFIL